jgi:hypothetical protein
LDEVLNFSQRRQFLFNFSQRRQRDNAGGAVLIRLF